MFDISNRVEEARALHDQALETLKQVPVIESLEVMRMLSNDDKEKRVIELALLLAKRQAKAEFETSDRWADFYDKAALPAGAGFPGFVAVLVSQNVLAPGVSRVLTIASCLVGGLFWLALRCGAAWYGNRAKAGIAKLGKVD